MEMERWAIVASGVPAGPRGQMVWAEAWGRLGRGGVTCS